MKIGTLHQTELQKLPEELVIPSDQIKLLDSIGQGEPGVYICTFVLAEHCDSLYVNMPGVTVE